MHFCWSFERTHSMWWRFRALLKRYKQSILFVDKKKMLRNRCCELQFEKCVDLKKRSWRRRRRRQRRKKRRTATNWRCCRYLSGKCRAQKRPLSHILGVRFPFSICSQPLFRRFCFYYPFYILMPSNRSHNLT